MKLRQIAGPCCKGIKCHAVFEDQESGKFFIQGQRISGEVRLEFSAGDDEDVVEVPRELLQEVANHLRQS